MSARPTPTEATPRDRRLVFTGDDVHGARIAGSQQADLLDFTRSERLRLLVSDGTLVCVQRGLHDEDFLWRVRVELPGTAAAQHREPVLNEQSERLELTGPGLRVFSATAHDDNIVAALLSGKLRVAELVEPERVCERFLSLASPRQGWVDEWKEWWCDPRNGILALRCVLAMRDAIQGAP